MAGISVKLPLSFDESDGAYLLNKELKDVVKQNLKMLLLTIPGERVMLPDFGVGIPKFLFEPNNLETQRQISKRIDQQVDKYMPFVSIRDVYVGPLDDDIHSIHHNSLHITIKYLVPHMAEQDILSIAIPNERDVSAGETFSGGY